MQGVEGGGVRYRTLHSLTSHILVSKYNFKVEVPSKDIQNLTEAPKLSVIQNSAPSLHEARDGNGIGDPFPRVLQLAKLTEQWKSQLRDLNSQLYEI